MQDEMNKPIILSGNCVVCGDPTVLSEPAMWDEYGQPMDEEWRCAIHRRADPDQRLYDVISQEKRKRGALEMRRPSRDR
jgi:hypothetical protein